MKRYVFAAVVVLCLPSFASAQATVRGVAVGATCTLTDSRMGPAVVQMSWIAADGRYEGTGNGVTYYLGKDGPDKEWAITLHLPGVATYWGTYRQCQSRLTENPIRFSGGLPVSGPAWSAYGYRETDSLPPFTVITITP